MTDYIDSLQQALRDAAAREYPAQNSVRIIRRRRVVRFGLALASVAVAVAVITSILAPAATQSAWAKQVMQRAADVLTPTRSPRTILHIVATQTQSPRAMKTTVNPVSSLTEEAWLQQGPPPSSGRVIVHLAGGPVLEQDSGHSGQTYDMTSNVLYPVASHLPSSKPRYTVHPGAQPDSYLLRVKLLHGFHTSTISSAEVNGLRNGSQTVSWSASWNGHAQQLLPVVVHSPEQAQITPGAEQPYPGSSSFAAQLHGLLTSGHAHVTRATTADGKPAIEITLLDPQSKLPLVTYYVNPRTYAPIELDSYGYGNLKNVTRLRFSVYETLPLAGHQRLLRYTTPPSARIHRGPENGWPYALLLPF
ncbi:MAG TPA: hypothetical protein VIK04_21010 [Solirubrobacteraceae bacterium]